MSRKPRTSKPHQSPAEIHAMVQAMLAQYATAAALGTDADAAYPDVAAHLDQCAVCRRDVAKLVEITRSFYEGAIEPPASYPSVNLSFLQAPSAPGERVPPAKPWWIGEQGQLIIQFSPALLNDLRPQMGRAVRGPLLYHYEQAPSLRDIQVTIDVFAADEMRDHGLVQVVVDVATLSPMDQGGSRVTVRAGERLWEGETDETGSVDFTPVPLAVIPTLRVEVEPRRT